VHKKLGRIEMSCHVTDAFFTQHSRHMRRRTLDRLEPSLTSISTTANGDGRRQFSPANHNHYHTFTRAPVAVFSVVTPF